MSGAPSNTLTPDGNGNSAICVVPAFTGNTYFVRLPLNALIQPRQHVFMPTTIDPELRETRVLVRWLSLVAALAISAALGWDIWQRAGAGTLIKDGGLATMAIVWAWSRWR